MNLTAGEMTKLLGEWEGVVVLSRLSDRQEFWVPSGVAEDAASFEALMSPGAPQGWLMYGMQ